LPLAAAANTDRHVMAGYSVLLMIFGSSTSATLAAFNYL
jgi:hypothetical protein